MKNFDTTLYFITDSTGYSEEEFLRRTEEALKGGATILQLREKDKTTREYISLAEKVHTLTKKYNVPLIIDDRVDVALATSAEGVHLGQSDMPISTARKILGDDSIRITATTVRVPVFNSHSESINVELNNPFELEDVFELFKNSEGIVVQDDVANNIYPMAITATGHDETFVGRIRRDESVESGVNLWVVADNIRKGAATNAVQIAQKLIEMNEGK